MGLKVFKVPTTDKSLIVIPQYKLFVFENNLNLMQIQTNAAHPIFK